MLRRRERGSAATKAAAVPERGAAGMRYVGIGIMYGGYRPRVLGGWRMPASGPVILAVNHANLLDGPLLFGVSPRPVHFLVKREAFVGPLGPFLRGIGQIPVDRHTVDRGAVTAALGVLKSGQVLGMFPEGTRGSGDFAEVRAGLAYFAVRSGAPIVPVACLGTDEPGRRLGPLPAPRRRLDVVFGDPFRPGVIGRRTRSAVAEASEEIRDRLGAHLVQARKQTGRD